MSGSVADRHYELSLATRAAWLHYAGGLTQAQVAKRLGLTSLKAHRLITKANHDGLVRIFIDGDIGECVELEQQLATAYSLSTCEVVPDLDHVELPLRALGIAGAQFLKREIERGEKMVIGVGHGRTLSASVEYLTRTSAGHIRFVSLLGGVTRRFAANPHDVIHRLAERNGAQAYVMPVPFVANTVEDREVLLGQRGISDVFELAGQADLMFVGIGTAEREASLVSTDMIEHSEIDEVKRQGGVGELLGHFFDGQGRPVETLLSDRMLTLPREQLQGRRIVAVAGGTVKTEAIRAVLKSGYLSGLITDETTARALTRLSEGFSRGVSA
ncbi:sugar-binding transcriptional regulator [Manganibacter manganicus]|uniref:DNA-binding transcriptional regulator n=1 Tax=Manganibacter manganicus TaxID=1873176 RepID=A0A1V8RTL0_9HYPH|nr:sugar-binding transcriptional regulator [Pseudaminobacter manganicus]OQM76369.1 DNA-binding transcriptional regulator [Pseudaminobacter manganicus]